MSQVVHGYGDVCQAITEMAVELNASVGSDDFRMMNRCLADAIAAAVTQYGHERDKSIDGKAADGTERLRLLAHELGNAIDSANGAFGIVKSGRVGIAGSTAMVLDRSLTRAQALMDRLLVEVYAASRSTDPTTAVTGSSPG